MHFVSFISLEEDDKDLIVSFAIRDGEFGIQSLILMRTLFYEEYLDESECGVQLSFENVTDGSDPIMLQEAIFKNKSLEIKSKNYSFTLDLSKIEDSEITETIALMKKQNHDNRFKITVA